MKKQIQTKSRTSYFSKRQYIVSPSKKRSTLITVPHACPTEEAKCDKNVNKIAEALYKELDPNKVIILGAVDRNLIDLNRKESEKEYPKWIEEIKVIFQTQDPIVLDVHTSSHQLMKGVDIEIFNIPQWKKDDKFVNLLAKRLSKEGFKVRLKSKQFMKRDFIVQTLLQLDKDRHSEIALLEFDRNLPPEETSKKVSKVLNQIREELI